MISLDDLAINPIERCYPQERLYTFSGRGSVAMMPNTTLGVGAFWFPPISGAEFGCVIKLHLPEYDTTIGDQAAKEHYAAPGIMLQSVRWLPWCTTRRGIYHRKVAGRDVCLEVASELYAPADGDGWVMAIDLKLHDGAALTIDLRPQITDPKHAFGICHDAAWNYEPPAARGIVWSQGAKHWRTDGCDLHFVSDENDATDAGWKIKLHPGQTRRVWIGATLHGKGMKPFHKKLADHAATSQAHWQTQWQQFTGKFGQKLATLGRPQQLLAARSWTTLMVSRWSRENFISNPYYATEGIDGGSICSYVWDLSYTSRIVAQLEGRSLRGLLERFFHVEDFWTGYALGPLDGHWMGVFYAFNPYALVKILSDYIAATDDVDFLRAPIGSGNVLDRAESWVREFSKRYASNDELLDFGHNRHLIELHTAGYEGRVPNPSFEHAWTLRTLNKLRARAGLAVQSEYETQAKQLLDAAEAAFWNKKAGWYFPAGQRDAAGIWSIQVLSALRLGVFSPENAGQMAAHLDDKGFLGAYGLHSIAPHDSLHFTLNDVDWGGGGCFTGHVGIVIEGLLRYGMRDAADRLLDRIAWWGTHLPYIPQSARADAPAAYQDRPNAVAAGAIAQALLMDSAVD